MDALRKTNPYTSGSSPFIKCECLLNVDKNIKTQYQDSAKQTIYSTSPKRKEKENRVSSALGLKGMGGLRARERRARTGVGQKKKKQSNKDAGSPELEREDRRI